MKSISIRVIAPEGFNLRAIQRPIARSVRFAFEPWNVQAIAPGMFRVYDPPSNINSAMDIAREYLETTAPSVFYLVSLEVFQLTRK